MTFRSFKILKKYLVNIIKLLHHKDIQYQNLKIFTKQRRVTYHDFCKGRGSLHRFLRSTRFYSRNSHAVFAVTLTDEYIRRKDQELIFAIR